MRSVCLWKAILPAFVLAFLWTACKKEESTSVEKPNPDIGAKFSGVAPDDPAKLATLPVVMSAQFYQDIQSGARRTKTPTPTTGTTDTTTTTPTTPPPTVIPPTTLPASYQLITPTPGNQGSEGSCVAWAAASGRSIEQYYRTNATGYSYSTNIFSPEFIFNIIQVGGCSSSAMGDAMYLLANKGVCTWQSMPYSSYDGCSTMPTSSQYAEAANYKIASYSVIYSSDTTAIKSSLAAKHPLVTTAVIDDNFYNATPGYIWNSMATPVLAHGLVIVGYDDSKHAFKAMNSWGTNWADGGFIWIDYTFFGTVASALYLMN